VLVVDGFDRQDYLLSPDQTVSGVPGRSNLRTFTRVIPWLVNDFTYASSHGRGLEAASFHVESSSATNDAVISGDVALGDHDVVIWLLGEESTVDETFSAAEQALVASHINGGGHLIVSGAEIGWDLGRSSRPQADQEFYAGVLGAGPYAASDDAAGVYVVSGASGTFLEGLSLEFSDGSGHHPNIEFADIIRPGAGATSVLLYSTGEPAAIFKKGTGGAGDVLLVGFPLEAGRDAQGNAGNKAGRLDVGWRLATPPQPGPSRSVLLAFTESQGCPCESRWGSWWASQGPR
jgi:hypothetical protein